MNLNTFWVLSGWPLAVFLVLLTPRFGIHLGHSPWTPSLPGVT